MPSAADSQRAARGGGPPAEGQSGRRPEEERVQEEDEEEARHNARVNSDPSLPPSHTQIRILILIANRSFLLSQRQKKIKFELLKF